LILEFLVSNIFAGCEVNGEIKKKINYYFGIKKLETRTCLVEEIIK